MKWNIFILGLMMVTTGILLQYSGLHNIDLSWNAKYVGLIDDNGFVAQDTIHMYNTAYRNLWAVPMIIIFGMVFMTIGGMNHGEKTK